MSRGADAFIFSCEARLRPLGAAGADVRQVAFMLRLTSVHAQHNQALTHLSFHAFLDRLRPGTLQGLRPAFVTADVFLTATFPPETVVSHLHTQPKL